MLFALTAGCATHYVTRGVDLYASGHYIEAAEVFERTEPRLSKSTQADCARYGLYRGATLLALGDTARANAWLGYAKAIADARDDSLTAEDRDMLNRALTLIASRRGSSPTPPNGDGSTLATRPAENGEVGN